MGIRRGHGLSIPWLYAKHNVSGLTPMKRAHLASYRPDDLGDFGRFGDGFEIKLLRAGAAIENSHGGGASVGAGPLERRINSVRYKK